MYIYMKLYKESKQKQVDKGRSLWIAKEFQRPRRQADDLTALQDPDRVGEIRRIAQERTNILTHEKFETFEAYACLCVAHC